MSLEEKYKNNSDNLTKDEKVLLLTCESYFFTQSGRRIVYRGKITIISEIEEKKHGFDILIDHLEKKPRETKKNLLKSDDDYIKPLILRLDIAEITCKEEKAES